MDNNRTYYSHEAEIHESRKNAALLFIALGVGAAAALMLAPTSGRKTRENLMHGIEQGVSKGREVVDPTIKRLEKELAELRKNVEERIKS
jgi:gas vesicle protein